MTHSDENDRSNLGEVLDSNIKLLPGRTLATFLQSNETNLTRDYSSKEYLTVGDIKELWKAVHGEDGVPGQKVYLNELLGGSKLILPNLVIPERNPELEKRIQVLKRKQAEKEYQKMVQNVSGGNRFKVEDSIGYQMKLMNTGLIGVFQFVISIGAAFLFGFIGVEVFGGITLDLAVKLLLGIVFALVVGLAELYFLAINLSISESGPETPVNLSNKTKEGHLKRQ